MQKKSLNISTFYLHKVLIRIRWLLNKKLHAIFILLLAQDF